MAKESKNPLIETITYDETLSGTYAKEPTIIATVLSVDAVSTPKTKSLAFKSGSKSLRSSSIAPNESSYDVQYNSEESVRATFSIEQPSPEPASKQQRETEPITSSIFEKSTFQTKDHNIITLEKLLTKEYNSPAIITNITELDSTRKKVKEVRFVLDNKLLKVWLFKATPEETAKELAIYHLAHEHGIPTGKPIGYVPQKNQKYPHKIAVIGGVIENAGESYNTLIKNMQIRPDMMFNSATAVAKIISNYQGTLNVMLDQILSYGVTLEVSRPRTEIMARLAAATKLGKDDVGELVDACEKLYDQQSGMITVSHRDIHTGNIVTIEEYHQQTKQNGLLVNKFGIIDWGSIGMDNPYSDPVDFWIHHDRQVHGATGKSEQLSMFKEYIKSYNSSKGIEYDGPDALIQLALWNIYEIKDPVRKPGADADAKMHFHYDMANKVLDILIDSGVKHSRKVKTELKNIMMQYLS